MAKRKTAARRRATAAARETRRSYATAPLGVLLVTPAALSNILNHGGVKFAPARMTARDTAVATPAPARTAAARVDATRKARTTGSNAGRGRVAGVYVPKTGVKLAKDLNPKVTRIFNVIKKNRSKGITQKALVKTSKLPNSTVWYALKRLQKDKSIAYQPVAA